MGISYDWNSRLNRIWCKAHASDCNTIQDSAYVQFSHYVHPQPNIQIFNTKSDQGQIQWKLRPRINVAMSEAQGRRERQMQQQLLQDPQQAEN